MSKNKATTKQILDYAVKCGGTTLNIMDIIYFSKTTWQERYLDQVNEIKL